MDHHLYSTIARPLGISNPTGAPRTSMHLASGECSPPLPHLTDDDDPPDPIDPYGSRIVTQSAGIRIPGGISRLSVTRKSTRAPAERLSIVPKQNTLSPKPLQPEEPPIVPYRRGLKPVRL